MDDIGIAANNATDLPWNIRADFRCIRLAGLKLTIEKCHFVVRHVEFLGRTIPTEGRHDNPTKFKILLNKLKFPKSKKIFTALSKVRKFLQKNIPRMAEKLNPFYKLLKAEVPINITSELKQSFDSVNNAPNVAFQLAFKRPNPGKPVVLMTDASFRSPG